MIMIVVNIKIMIMTKITNALCCYPHVKLEIGNLSQITTTAPIFLQFNYFRENIWVTIWLQFHFLDIYL